MKKKFSVSSKLVKSKKTFEFFMTVGVDDIEYKIKGFADEEDGVVKSIRFSEVKYVDPIGEIPIEGKRAEKLKRLIKENIVGNFSEGFEINKPLYIKLKNFTPWKEVKWKHT